MAFIEAKIAKSPVAEYVLAALKSVGNFFLAITVAQSRAAEFERMNKLSDVELATKYGINRDQIAAHVFRDKMF